MLDRFAAGAHGAAHRVSTRLRRASTEQSRIRFRGDRCADPRCRRPRPGGGPPRRALLRSGALRHRRHLRRARRQPSTRGGRSSATGTRPCCSPSRTRSRSPSRWSASSPQARRAVATDPSTPAEGMRRLAARLGCARSAGRRRRGLRRHAAVASGSTTAGGPTAPAATGAAPIMPDADAAAPADRRRRRSSSPPGRAVDRRAWSCPSTACSSSRARSSATRASPPTTAGSTRSPSST